ncbi:MAG: sigma-54-dependent Fis family transcriptional regulator [Nitrospira sp.]|uniref:Fis family transcriptional regulator n=1 Tax=Nitrospira defluvii TaxID=330214 RepID=A0ABN7LDA2_9BACT|nr:sigma-54 dependent transcriptional regulator [Nitrospira defluvii]MCS6328675.1 sigma-54-dependent Fis family transcriptional regulator [Nitrospira sp.]CAE6744164.1 Fis family transcriptional regulator [Nitrospira defluvii]
MKGLRVLIVDDEPLMRLSMLDALEGVGCEVAAAATGTEGVTILGTRQFDVVITDLRLPGADGLTILKVCKERSATTEVILITAHASVDTAVGAIKLGAYDYITKPFQMDELLLIVERVGKIIGLRRENLELKEVLEDRFSFGGIHGCHQHMRALLERLKVVAATESSVSIVGERGTGKELVAHTIHLNSPRRDQPLIKIGCGDLPERLLEAELFGHEKGAFPGALRQRRGRFELAHKGTLLLDDIDALSPHAQKQVWQVLQERKCVRLGGREPLEIDVRILCASQQDLREAVAQGRFLPDLGDYLTTVQLVVPPLRERRDDVLVIAEHLLETSATTLHKSLKGFSQSSRDLLMRYSFPGNVQELKRMVDRAVASGRNGEPLQPWDLCGFQTCPFLGGAPQPTCGFCTEGLVEKSEKVEMTTLATLAAAREAFERDYILAVLQQVDGSRTSAAALLGLSRKALWDKCKRYGISSTKCEAEEGEE